jgi:hypothetical protein
VVVEANPLWWPQHKALRAPLAHKTGGMDLLQYVEHGMMLFFCTGRRVCWKRFASEVANGSPVGVSIPTRARWSRERVAAASCHKRAARALAISLTAFCCAAPTLDLSFVSNGQD